MSDRILWIDTGNGERSAVVEDPENHSNYKSLRVWPNQAGGFSYEVNGFFRGSESTRDAAKREAVAFARKQIVGEV